MNNSFLSRLLCAAVVVVAVCGFAGELGQPAAPLKISAWIKGKPVDLDAVKGKQIVVVEFWATWCPPCLTSIPHLTALQKKFKDVIIVGVSGEEAATVRKFVTKMGDQMDYTVAIDDNQQTDRGYMAAFGQSGIPHAFIVDLEGRVVWQGFPLAGLEETLAQLVAGKFDLVKAKKRAGAELLMNEFYDAVMTGTDEAKVDRLGKELEALDAEVGGLTPGQKFSAAAARKTVKFRSLLRDYQIAVRANNSRANLDRIEQLLAQNAPADFNLGRFKEAVRLDQVFNEYYLAAAGYGNADSLAGLAKKVAELKTTDATVLNDWSLTLLADERIKHRDYELATKLAKAAVEATDGKEAVVLNTYARALFDSGNIADGIAWQKKAIAAASDDGTKQQLGETLKKYEEKAAAK
jgi:thiol-disulfide isomerase/thioredoxin